MPNNDSDPGDRSQRHEVPEIAAAPPKRWQVAAMIVLAPGTLLTSLVIGLVVFVPLVLLSLPYCALLALTQAAEERHFRDALRERGRLMAWEQLEPDLTAGKGTLIIEQANKRPVRIWWTDEDVGALAPVAPPLTEELDVLGSSEPHPFVIWCFSRYLAAAGGRALLTVPSFSLPPGLFFAEFFQERFPAARAIDTVYVARR
jgi:hypothetical protein